MGNDRTTSIRSNSVWALTYFLKFQGMVQHISQIQTENPETQLSARLRQTNQVGNANALGIHLRAVAVAGLADTTRPARQRDAEPVLNHCRCGQLPTLRRPDYSLPKSSLSSSLNNLRSATIVFQNRFCSSITFMFKTTNFCIPPYFDRHV